VLTCRSTVRGCSVAARALPQASIVADRFYVTKIVNEDVNQVRRAVLKANENNPDPVEKVKVKEA